MKLQSTKKMSGQSTLEYVILLAGVISFLAVFVGQRNGYFQKTLEDSHIRAADQITDLSSRLAGSYDSK